MNLVDVQKFHFVSEYNDDLEREETHNYINNIVDEPTLLAIIDPNRFSSLSHLLRVTGKVIEFIRKLKTKIQKKEEEDTIDQNKTRPEAEEIDDLVLAKKMWILETQKEFDSLKYKQTKQSLKVFKDTSGILRCHGRIGNAPLPFDTKYPILLPKNSRFTTLVVNESHVNVGHNKTRETLNDIRSSYWIPQGRSLVKNVINKCTVCRLFEGKTCFYPDAPKLPKERVEQGFAFDNISIDYAGPVYVKDQYSDETVTHKAWIALITCSSSRAVYLDIATDYSADALIRILERFFNRYGAPRAILSDNGSNFTAKLTQDYVHSRFIQWSFNTEAAPWQGGIFERLVQSTKRILRKCLRKEVLTHDELSTLLKKIENILNNRPITHVYDSEIGQPLTPNHLIYGRKIQTSVKDPDVHTNELNCDAIKRALAYFWEQWKVEYLTSLRERSTKRRFRNHENVANVGDVCLIEEPGPRIKWKMGRIEELVKGKDDKIRAAVVRTMKGQLNRPVNKLVVIESSTNDKNDIDYAGIKFVKDAQQTIENK